MQHRESSSGLRPATSPFPDVEVNLGVDKGELEYMVALWPHHYGTLYDMGTAVFEKLFLHNPALLDHPAFVEGKANWKENDTIKKMVLALQQLLTDAVNILGEGEHNNPEFNSFVNTLRELGGLHRAIAEDVNPEAFNLFFALLPEVVVDVTSNRRKAGPFTPEERLRLVKTWRAVGRFMANQVMAGWERSKTPTHSKYLKAFMERHPCPNGFTPTLTVPQQQPPGAISDRYEKDTTSESSSVSIRQVSISPLSVLRR